MLKNVEIFTAAIHCMLLILKFYRKVYFTDTEACQGLHLFPLFDVILISTLPLCILTGIRVKIP